MFNLIKLDLQMFTDGGTEGGEGGNGTDNNGEGSGQAAALTQADVDAQVAQARAQWEADQQAQNAEAQRLAGMNADERAAHNASEIERLMAEIARRDLRNEVVNMLADQSLPANFVDFIPLTTAEEIKTSVGALAKAFGDSVKAEVEKRLKGSAKTPGSGGASSKKDGSIGSRVAKSSQPAKSKKENPYF